MAVQNPLPTTSTLTLRRISLLLALLLGGLGVVTLIAGTETIAFLQAITPGCFFKQITHVPCLFCGFTRSIILLMQGDLPGSFNYHPLGLPFFVSTAGFLILGLIRRPVASRMLEIATRKPFVFGIIGLLVAVWIWKLTRDPAFW